MRAACTLSLVAFAWSTIAHADPERPSTDAGGVSPVFELRREVVVGVSGPFDADARATFVRLLRAELDAQQLVLLENDPRGEPRAWAHTVTRSERRLLAVLLDTRAPAGWRVVVIDAARGRAISRELPRGERDAAAVEAVVSIVLSATRALREGLEVASAPLETVVEPRVPAPASPPAAPRPTRAAKPPPERSAHSSSGTSLHGSLAAEAASFAAGAEPTFGATLAAGAALASRVEVDTFVARTLPRRVDSDFGSFALERTTLGVSAGPRFGAGSFAFVPAAGVCVEWIGRSDTEAAPGAASNDDSGTTVRAGGRVELRARYRLVANAGVEHVSLLATAGASYFTESVRFLAGTELIAEARHAAFQGGVGLFVATDAL
ncbi:MAG TPA: hypothetical protein VFZ53_33345 [Polyangiaceae bacterium]